MEDRQADRWPGIAEDRVLLEQVIGEGLGRSDRAAIGEDGVIAQRLQADQRTQPHRREEIGARNLDPLGRRLGTGEGRRNVGTACDQIGGNVGRKPKRCQRAGRGPRNRCPPVRPRADQCRDLMLAQFDRHARASQLRPCGCDRGVGLPHAAARFQSVLPPIRNQFLAGQADVERALLDVRLVI